MADLIPRGLDFQQGQLRPLAAGDYLVDATGLVLQGLTGIIGLTGIFGITGLLGIQGLTGISLPGNTGLQGETGLIGNTGLQGLTGLQGTTGITGPTAIGNTGIIGQTGIAGVTGLLGNPGSQGIQGITGIIGATGAIGSTGLSPTGLAPLGVTGLTGETGIQTTGLQGITGASIAGVTGLQGHTGLRGITGINDYQILNTQYGIAGSTLVYVVTANTLSVNNQQIDLQGFGVSATNGTTTQAIITFGGTIIFVDSFSGSEGSGISLEGTILRVSSTSQQVVVSAVYEDGTSHVQRTNTSVNLAADQNLFFVMNSQGPGDVALNLIVKKILD
jgi:hypothetical protein